MGRLPIRLRLTLPFALLIAVLLAATGLLIYQRIGETLLANVDQSLRGQALEAASRVAQGSTVLDRDAPGGPGVGQVIGADGRVRGTEPTGLPALVTPATLRRVIAGGTVLRSGEIPGLEEEWRILAAPARIGGAPVAVVVATSLKPRAEARDRLLREFMFEGPVALMIAILAGYGLAAAALRPVEAMRRRAASITASTPGARLPTSRSHDEISRLGETLNDMLARLEAAFEHERRFVDDASHELRTPLSLLRTELELALRHPRSHAELERALRSASEETERLTKLAEDLLLFARYDQRRLPIRPERIDVATVVDEVATRYRPPAQDAGRTIRVVPPGSLVLDADPLRVEQALGNLVDNALTHGAGTIEISARPNNGRIELHVSDEGPGVPPEFQARAFDRFSRADDARGRGGSGLGLAIVDLIAQAHGGEVGLAAGAGTDVWISLPAAPVTVEPSASRARAQ